MTENEQEKAATRTLVLEAALRLFAAKGYFNTSIQDIRREAGVSIGSIYHYFSSKEVIAQDLYQSLLSQMTILVEGQLARHGSFEEKCRGIIQALFMMADENSAQMQFLLNAKHQEFLPDLAPICAAEPFVLMEAAATEAIAAGEVIDVDSHVLVTAIFGGPMRLMLLVHHKQTGRKLMDMFAESWRCVWRGVRA